MADTSLPTRSTAPAEEPTASGESTTRSKVEQRASAAHHHGSTSRHPRGPRSLYIKRSEHGFGFTLRHFIVYPPESYSVLAGNSGRHGPGGGRLDEPMDTIFVKHVREKSAAQLAGLATGDRLVCVNGASVAGLSYAQVVQLIQQSGEFLHLLVVPRQDDLLQLYFAETAHNPCTNPRPWEVKQHDIYPDHHPQQQRSDIKMLSTYQPTNVSPVHRTLPRRASDGNVSWRHNNGNVVSLPQRANSVERETSEYLSNNATESDSVINRIKKSFEQKEEFLRRPNQPIWLPSSASSTSSNSSTNSTTQQQQQIREFYSQPQKFQNPIWPPNDENNSPRAQFLCGGPVTNNMQPPRTTTTLSSDGTSLRPPVSPLRVLQAQTSSQQPSTRPFISTLTRITENQPTGPPPEVQIVSHRARQFESGRVEDDRIGLYRSELARLSSPKSVPDVAHRKQEFESKSRSLDSTVVMGRPPRPPKQEQKQKIERERSLSPPTPPIQYRLGAGLSGNRIIPVGGRYVPNDVDIGWLDDDETSTDKEPAILAETPSRSRSNSVDSWTPVASQQKEKRLSTASIQQQQTTQDPRPVRPTQLSLQNPLRPPSPPHASTAESVQRNPSPPEPSRTTSSIKAGDVTTQIVQMRRPRQLSADTEERLVRRESYLKATWSDRMHVDSDLDSPSISPQHEERPSIPRLRAMFSSDRNTTQPNQQTQVKPEGILREGWLQCKFSLQDGKRATDRSWKQVWAVLRGNTLYLRKERKDSTAHHGQPTPATSSTSLQHTEETAVPLRGCLVDAAADYTKKKHVLRVHTPADSQLLLQAEDPHDMAKWLQLLRPRAQDGTVEDVTQEPPLSPGPEGHSPPQVPRLSPQAAHKGIRKLTTSFRNRSPTGQSPVNKTRKPSQNEPLASPKTKTWKGRVAKQLRRIHGASPSSPTTPHPEGVTIGVPLEDCPPSLSNEFVPLLVELCTGIVEERGLEIIGIYRVPGNTAAVTSLTEGVNKGFDELNLQEDPRWNDVNVISSLLKSFFRKLPDSLFTSELYPQFVASDRIEDPKARFRRIRKLVRELPEHHYETLRYLMAHLNKVVQHSKTNKMEAKNLAIVFGPTLVRTSDDNMVAMVTDMPHQCRIVESLISHADWFFSEEEDTDDLETPNVPPGLTNDTSDSAASDALNHSLLLNNIHKVEGYGSPSKEISAKDIVSSIISAANKKMQKAKTRRGTRLGSEESSDARDDDKHGDKGSTKSHGRESLGDTTDSPPSSAGHDHHSIASSIFSSVLFSGNIVKSIHAPQTAPQPSQSTEPTKPLDGAPIHSYAGLTASTKERIRRFEIETIAMMSRDLTKLRDESRDKELDWQKTKHELESDILHEISESPVELRKKPSDMDKRHVGKPPMGASPSKTSSLTTDHTALAVLSSLRAIRRGNSVENLSANVSEITTTNAAAAPKSAFDTQKVAPNGTLKRLKTGKEQAIVQSPSSLSNLRCGSLDSLHDACVQESKADQSQRSDTSDDGHDLLASLTSTFDKKMRSLMKNDTDEHETSEEDSRTYRDPSLHKPKTQDFSSPSQDSKVRLREKDRNNKRRDSDSPARLSKIEKEARNNSVNATSSSLLLARLKRKSAMHLQRGIKRRHTVGGTKDLAKLGWLSESQETKIVLSEAQQQAALRAWLQRGRLRSSSPELSPRTAASLLLIAAAELSQAFTNNKQSHPDILTSLNVPLESHV